MKLASRPLIGIINIEPRQVLEARQDAAVALLEEGGADAGNVTP
jgi:hypothetical protein